MTLLPLTPDQLLSTTRAVRKRLDFDRSVPDELIRECVDLAMQSPSGSNNMTMQFVVVRDAAKRAAIGEIYRQCYGIYSQLDGVYIGSIDKGGEAANAQQQRSTTSADFLGDRMGDAPALVIACTGGRADGLPAMMTSSMFGNVLPAMWSFMLAARARGLGTCWVASFNVQAAREVLGLPEGVEPLAFTPLGYPADQPKPKERKPLAELIRYDQW